MIRAEVEERLDEGEIRVENPLRKKKSADERKKEVELTRKDGGRSSFRAIRQ